MRANSRWPAHRRYVTVHELTLAVRDLRELRSAATDELADYETDLLAGSCWSALGRAGRQHHPQRHNHRKLIRDWFARPLWEMQPADADAYFGKVLRVCRSAGT
jgi:hypothetical protein